MIRKLYYHNLGKTMQRNVNQTYGDSKKRNWIDGRIRQKWKAKNQNDQFF